MAHRGRRMTSVRMRGGDIHGAGAATRAAASAGRSGGGAVRWLAPLALALLHIALALLVLDPTPFTGGDNAAYISLARSLLERGSYVELWDPALPPHTQYPPVFPAVLALASLLGIGPWVGFKVVVVAFSTAAVVLTYLWLARRVGRGPALAVAAVLAVSPGVLVETHLILSDVPFWAFTMLALWGFERLEPRERGRCAVAIAAVVLAYFTRSAGLPLVIAATGWLVLERRWRALAILAGILGPLALLWALRGHANGGNDYVQQFWMLDPYRPELGRIGVADLTRRMLDNARSYATVHLPILLAGRASAAAVVLAVLAVAGCAVGWIPRLRRPGVAELFLPLYIGLLLVWPEVWSGERFLLPALPLILGYAAAALRSAVMRFRPQIVRWVGVAAVGAVVLAGLPTLVAQARAARLCAAATGSAPPYRCLPQLWNDFFAVAQWVDATLPSDAVVLSRKPRLFYVLSGRRGRLYPYSSDPATFFAAAEDAGARYVVLGWVARSSMEYITDVISQRPSAFCVRYALGPGRAAVLGILPGGVPPDSAAAREEPVVLRPCPAGFESPRAPDGRP